MNDKLNELLGQLEERLDPSQQAEVHDVHLRALKWEPTDRLPLVLMYPLPKDCPFQPYPYRETFDDPEKMLFNELLYAFKSSIYCGADLGDDLPFTVRANCGIVIVASMFGGRFEVIEDNPPWVYPYDGLDELQQAFDVDPLDFTRGICPKIIDIYKCYREILSDYPNVRRCVKIILPDLQGPLDTVEILRSSALYVDFYERPELIRRFLDLAAQAQVGFARRLQDLITDKNGQCCHQHATVQLGHILVRGDSSVLISARMYREHIAPHDEFVLREMDGGGIHFCGKGDHLIDVMAELPSIRSIDFGQSEMNDMDAIYSRAKDRRIALVRVHPSEEELVSGRIRDRFPTGVSLAFEAKSFEHAKQIWSAYLAATARR